MFDSRTVSGAALAYLGDAVLEVLVRTRLVEAGYTSSKALNARALDYVRASAQARAMERIRPCFTADATSGTQVTPKAPRWASIATRRAWRRCSAIFP